MGQDWVDLFFCVGRSEDLFNSVLVQYFLGVLDCGSLVDVLLFLGKI